MSGEMPFLPLAQDVILRIEGARLGYADELEFPCPIDNATARILVNAGPLGDAIWCDGNCEDDDLERAVRYLVSALPRLCRDPHRTDYGHDKTCPRCLRYAVAVRPAYQAINASFGRGSMQDDDEGSDWAPVSLVDAEPVPDPCILEIGSGSGLFLFRMGWITLIHGSQGSGKTPLCYLAIVEQVRAGNLAVVLDYEMGISGAKKLLIELGLTEAEIRDGVVFFDGPGSSSAVKRKRLVEEVRRQEEETGRKFVVAVIDSLTESMFVEPGLDDNNAGDVMVWFNAVPKWLVKEFGVAVLLIDHSGVNDSERPSGSHKKREIPQFHIWVKVRTAFSRTHANGQSDILVMKDRSGQSVVGKVVAELHTKLNSSFYVSPAGASMSNVLTLTIPNNSMDDDVLSDLQNAGSNGMGKTEVTGGGTAGQFRRDALKRLIASGKVVTRKVGRYERCWASEFDSNAAGSVSVSVS